MQKRIRDNIRSNVIGYVALFCFAMGGTAYATHPGGADTISSGDIINEEIRTQDLRNGEVKQDDLGANAVASSKIADRGVKNADLGLGASSSNTIADGGIQGVDVKNNTLTGTQIDELSLDSAVLQRRIADSCPAGQAIRAVAQSGTVTCEGVGGGGGSFWSLSGNSGTTASDFLGTTDNNPLNLRVNDARALRLEPEPLGPNVIGGIANNGVELGVHSATIGGGGDTASGNVVTDSYGTVGGGANNQAGDGAGNVGDRTHATVGGGGNNMALGEAATVGGGLTNHAFGSRATVAGGADNTASGERANVAGGSTNTASGEHATVAGGSTNTASGVASTVVGGAQNTAQGDGSLAGGLGAQANHNGAFVWADSNPFGFASTAGNEFSVRSTGGARFVSAIDFFTGAPTAGLELPAGTSGWSTLVNGQPFDIRVNNARGLRIDPASDGTNQSPNVIGGIADNQVTSGVHSATIGGGGRSNPADSATANKVTDNFGTVGGGAQNRAGDAAGAVTDRQWGTVGGGNSNTAGGEAATVGGGARNQASASTATVGGGNDNTASGASATVGGGSSNTASASSATVSGGLANTASGFASTAVGGDLNTAQGDLSLAGGLGALANHNGAFVWADSSPFFFASTAQDEFSVRSTGGARFVSAIDNVTGDPTAGVELAPGGGSWSSLSDAASKRTVEPVSGREVLRELDSVPISTWSYRSQDDSIRHIGPMAQDFYRAFGVGEDRRHISSVDADGVALAAIKGLSRKVERLQHKVGSLQEEDSR